MMHQQLLIAILSGLVAMFGWGFADLFAKKTIDEVGSIISLVWAHIFGTVALILIVLFRVVIIGGMISIPSNPNVWAGLLFFGILQMIIYLLVYQGFSKGQLAILSPIFASYSGMAAK